VFDTAIRVALRPRYALSSVLGVALIALGGLVALGGLAGCDTTVSLVSGGGDRTKIRFQVEVVEPAAGAVEVGPRFVLRIRVSRPIDRSRLPARPVALVRSADDVVLTGRSTFEPAVGEPGDALEDLVDRVIVWSPDAPIAPGPVYRLEISPDLVSVDGDAIELDDAVVEYASFATPPTLAGSVRATATSSASIEVDWDAGSDDETPEAALTYEVFTALAGESFDLDRAAAATAPGVLRTLLTGLAPGTEYRIVVRALDAVGNPSALTAEVTAMTDQIIDLDPPAFDGVATLEAASPTALRVKWSAAVDDVDAPELIRYNAYLAVDEGGQDFGGPCLNDPGTLCRTSPAGATELEIDELDPDASYFVVVRAIDTSGNESTNTEELGVVTPVSFARQILPMMTHPVRGCTIGIGCHDGPSPRDELSLDSYEGLMRGGISQRTQVRPPVIVPGEEISDEMQSHFLWRCDTTNVHFEGPVMPLGRAPWSADQLGTLKRWIFQGALDN